MARGRTTQVKRFQKPKAQTPKSDNAVASSSLSPAPEATWDQPAATWDQPVGLDAWDNPDDNAWQWEAAGDESIASNDPNREKKRHWRMEFDHIHSSDYRVKKWREALGGQPLATFEEVTTYIERPAEVYEGGRSASRSRSRSRGRQGKRDRLQAVADWKARGPLLARPSEPVVDMSLPTISDELQAWIDDLVTKHKYSHLRKERAVAFFELPLDEKVNKVENLSREIGATMIKV